MSLVYEARASHSPFVESVTRGLTTRDDAVIRPAESCWHLVVVRQHDQTRTLLVGPWTASGITSYTAGVELLWIRFRLGVFMPHLPTRSVLNLETLLPEPARRTFWLKDAPWPIPDYDTAEQLVDRLVRAALLVRDPLVADAAATPPQNIAERTLRYRFERAAGVTQGHIRQLQRAQEARAMLARGVSIPDTMFELGYFDQSHLTRSLKRFIGYTPAQLLGPLPPA